MGVVSILDLTGGRVPPHSPRFKRKGRARNRTRPCFCLLELFVSNSCYEISGDQSRADNAGDVRPHCVH